MPIEIANTDDGNGNVIVFRGVITDQAYLDAFRKHLSQDAEVFRRYKYSLIDTRPISDINLSTGAIEQIALLCEKVSKINPDPVIAFVAKSDLVFGLSRMYEALVGHTDWEIMVFRSREEAVEWIRKRVGVKLGLTDLTFG